MRAQSHRLALIILALMTVASTSSAQPAQGKPPTAAQPPVITPPALKKDEGAKYPDQALKDKVKDRVEVVVVLDIGADGVVTNAVVEGAPGHGFEAAAVE